jgi:hypothetical protein
VLVEVDRFDRGLHKRLRRFGSGFWSSPYVRNLRGTLTGAVGFVQTSVAVTLSLERSLKDIPKSLHLDQFCLFIAIEFWRSSGWLKNLHWQIIDDAN